MALSDKDIIITPNKSQSADPKIEFRGADSTTGPQTITVRAYPTNGGTISFEGSSGQLFAVTNSLTGTLFSVNDASGVPSIEVLDTGNIRLAQYAGSVGIGTSTPTAKLHVAYTSAQISVDGTAQLLTLENSTTTDTSGNLAGIRFRQTNSTNSANGFVGMSSTGTSATRGSLIFASPNTSGNATEKMRLTVYGSLLV